MFNIGEVCFGWWSYRNGEGYSTCSSETRIGRLGECLWPLTVKHFWRTRHSSSIWDPHNCAKINFTNCHWWFRFVTRGHTIRWYFVRWTIVCHTILVHQELEKAMKIYPSGVGCLRQGSHRRSGITRGLCDGSWDKEVTDQMQQNLIQQFWDNECSSYARIYVICFIWTILKLVGRILSISKSLPAEMR